MATVSEINRLIEQQKQNWWEAKARGDQAAMDAAHREAERLRASGGTLGANTVTATDIAYGRRLDPAAYTGRERVGDVLPDAYKGPTAFAHLDSGPKLPEPELTRVTPAQPGYAPPPTATIPGAGLSGSAPGLPGGLYDSRPAVLGPGFTDPTIYSRGVFDTPALGRPTAGTSTLLVAAVVVVAVLLVAVLPRRPKAKEG